MWLFFNCSNIYLRNNIDLKDLKEKYDLVLIDGGGLTIT